MLYNARVISVNAAIYKLLRVADLKFFNASRRMQTEKGPPSNCHEWYKMDNNAYNM